jgi:hypothetical protein
MRTSVSRKKAYNNFTYIPKGFPMKRQFCVLLSVLFFYVSADAKLIETDAVLLGYKQTPKEKVLTFMERNDVAAAFERLGLAPETAKMQVAALTDAELADLSTSIDTAPAGGDILGIALFVCLVLLMTDILGMTKVFPFTKPIR